MNYQLYSNISKNYSNEISTAIVMELEKKTIRLFLYFIVLAYNRGHFLSVTMHTQTKFSGRIVSSFFFSNQLLNKYVKFCKTLSFI